MASRAGSVGVAGSAVIVGVLGGAGGPGCGDDVPHLLDAVADGGDEDFQCEGVGEGSTEFGVAPVGAQSLVVVLRGRDGVERLAARMAVPVVRLMGRWCRRMVPGVRPAG